MKTFKSILTLAFIMCLCSCSESPIIGNEKTPFVVKEISYYNDDMCEYFGPYDCARGLLRPSLILPMRAYNVGDTIKSFPK